MHCPYCRCRETRVVDSREHAEGESIRRRRECPTCLRRFTTYERLESAVLRVVKRDGRREDFDRDKLRAKVRLALAKRPYGEEQIDAVVGTIERELLGRGEQEVPSAAIGDLVMQHLRELDHVAYIRFASVYLNLPDLDGLRLEIENLTRDKALAGHAGHN